MKLRMMNIEYINNFFFQHNFFKKFKNGFLFIKKAMKTSKLLIKHLKQMNSII